MPEFFDRYINQVDKETDLIAGLLQSKDDFELVKASLGRHQDYRYQPEKWTPRDVLQHVIDNELIQSYRALAFSRNDQVVLPGYDEQLYAAHSSANERTVDDLLAEFQIVRKASIFLFQNLREDQFHISGVCSGVEVTPLALGFQILGHQIHHLKILKERYFGLDQGDRINNEFMDF